MPIVATTVMDMNRDKMKRSESKKLILAGHDRPSDNNTDRGKGETSTKLKSD